MKTVKFLFVLMLIAPSLGFFWNQESPEEGAPKVPENMPVPKIEESSYYDELMESYGDQDAHERVKIEFITSEIEKSPYSFVRNGITFPAKITAKHLRKKYMRRFDEIKTAKDFVNEIATESSSTGKPYLVKPGDGRVYYSEHVLHFGLVVLENSIEEHIKRRGAIKNSRQKKAA